MKIALSGPSGLGKTTLCRFITEELSVPWLSTSAGDILTDVQKEHLRKEFNYYGTGHRDVINLSSQYPEFGKTFQNYLLVSRFKQIQEHSKLVIDRSPIDNVAYFLAQNGHNQDEGYTRYFIDQAVKFYSSLTHVIQIRFSPDIPHIEDNGSRIPNRFYQQYMSDVFAGVYSRYFANLSGPRVLTIDFWDLRQRKDLVYQFITGQTKIDW